LVDEPVQFEVAVEVRAITNPGRPGPMEFGEPEIHAVPVDFQKVAPLRYQGSYIATHLGRLRFLVKAKGTKPGGATFAAEVVANGPVVHAVSARFLGIDQQIVDEDADGVPDRLHVSADLNVAVAGRYALEIQLSQGTILSPVPTDLGLHREAELEVGRQRLKASIPVKALWERARMDGAYHSGQINITRLQGNFVADSVDPGGTTFITHALNREDWRDIPRRLQPPLMWRASDRLGSGKAQMLELDWPVFSPGGRCTWSAILSRLDGVGRIVLEPTVANLPEGDLVLPFDVLANRLLPFHTSIWRLEPTFSCESSALTGTPLLDQSPRIPFNAALFESLERGMLMRRMPPLLVVPGQPALIQARFEKSAENTPPGQLTVESTSDGIQCVVDPFDFGKWTATPSSRTRAGIHEIVLALDSAEARTTLPVILQVEPKLHVQPSRPGN
jgi:hypothetical protein